MHCHAMGRIAQLCLRAAERTGARCAVSLHGAGDLPLSNLRGVEVVLPSRSVGDESQAQAPKVVEKRPYVKRRTNTTGRVRLSNLSRKRGVSGAALRQVAEAVGIPVYFVSGHNHNVEIEVKDAQRLLDAYDAQMRKENGGGVEVNIKSGCLAVEQLKADAELIKAAVTSKPVAGPAEEVSDAAQKAALYEALARVVDKDQPDSAFENNRQEFAGIFDLIPDRALVLELRHREYTVTCVKRIEL